jgi:hypothetical protein
LNVKVEAIIKHPEKSFLCCGGVNKKLLNMDVMMSEEIGL